MATNLYEALGLPSNDATPEQVRKAYRKKALQTHPDRLRPDATAEEKAAAEEQFRQVNNAYEVLSNEEKRKMYDLHGVWPPPQAYEEPDAGRRHRYEPYERQSSFGRDPFSGFNNSFFQDGPFGGDGFGSSFPFGPSSSARRGRPPVFAFTDPFELFQHVFRNDPFFSGALREDPFFASSPFGAARSPFGGDARSPFGMLSMFPEMQMLTGPGGFGSGSGSGSFHSSSRTMMGRSGGGGVSETYMTRTINGVTETIHKRRDAEGNEHVTLTYPDGRTKRTINGIEQPSGTNGSLPAPPTRPPPPPAIAAPPQPGWSGEGGGYSGDYRSSHARRGPAVSAPPDPGYGSGGGGYTGDYRNSRARHAQPYAPPAQPYVPPAESYSAAPLHRGASHSHSHGHGTDAAPDAPRHAELRTPHAQTTAAAPAPTSGITAAEDTDAHKRHSKRLSLSGLLKPLVKLVKPHAHAETKPATH